MISIAIVEDNEKERRFIRSCLEEIAKQEGISLHVEEFPSGTAFLGNYQPFYDIVLMDIEMPIMNGMETARMLRKIDEAVLLLFVTNMSQYAVQGYDVDALDFIVKPINPYSFAIKLKRALARTVKQADDVIPIYTEGEMHMVKASAIRYLEVSGHYVIYHTTTGVYSEYSTLKNVEKKINKPHFVRCNRCYLVNLRYVTAIKKELVYLGKEELLISRPQKKLFLESYVEYLGGRTNV
ncbi:MAG: response regulator transcription factor [Clostridia bacterium]|nr:response regulator transcription factor [Clostridia bacterium]